MNDDIERDDLERRLTRSLHASAPRSDRDLVDRLLRRTAVLGQRRGWSGLRFAPALAAGAVVVSAIVAGLALGTLLPRNDRIGGPSPSEVASPTQSTQPTATPTPRASAEASGTEPALADGTLCENATIGYTVRYPADWWANEPVVPDAPELTPIDGCVAFAEEPIELVPNSELPPGVAISAGVTEPPAGNPTQPIEVLREEEIEVAGRPATVSEIEWTEDAVFFSAGDRVYEYRIQLASGQTLLFTTRMNEAIDAGAYENNKAVLDAMMATLELAGG